MVESGFLHKLYVAILSSIVVFVFVYLLIIGYDYYITPIDERFYHEHYKWLGPSGLLGQGLGIIGTLMILFGVVLYIVAKKYGIFDKFIRLKYILEFHIFLCTLGPILILFHTTFKFGGVVSIAFWSMVAVVLSGVVGRYIYIQIPRSIEGRELSLEEVRQSQNELINEIGELSVAADEVQQIAENKELYYKLGPLASLKRYLALQKFARDFESKNSGKSNVKKIKKLIRSQWSVRRKMAHMTQMQKIFKYWHVAHKPFAIIMLVIVVVHVAITVSFGYLWIWG